jgi:hypothetical protein
MSEKAVMVTFKEKEEPLVNFKGIWTRVDIQRAFKTMLRSLPKHIQQQKIIIEKEKEIKEKKQNGITTGK